MEGGSKSNLDLWAGEVVDVVNDIVDELQDAQPSFQPTILEKLSCHLVIVTCFTMFHVANNGLKITNCHLRDFHSIISFELKDINIVQPAQIIKFFVKVCVIRCCSPKIFSIRSKTLRTS